MVLAVCMTVSSFEVSAYAAEQGTAEEKIIQVLHLRLFLVHPG